MARAMAMRELIARVLVSSPERPAPYLRNQLPAQCRRSSGRRHAAAAVHPSRTGWRAFFPARQSLKHFEVYIGGRGATFPVLHYDGLHTHAVIMQIYGQKEFLVVPARAVALHVSASRDRGQQVAGERRRGSRPRAFSLFAQARATRFVLNPGESLFVPCRLVAHHALAQRHDQRVRELRQRRQLEDFRRISARASPATVAPASQADGRLPDAPRLGPQHPEMLEWFL